MADSIEKVQEKCIDNPFPGSHIDPELKGSPDFGTKVGRAIFWRDRYQDMSYNRRRRIAENRRYANNNQDVTPHKKRVDPTFGNKETNPILGEHNIVNINYRVFSVMKKFVNSIIGMMTSARPDAVVQSMSKSSTAQKEAKRKAMMIELELRDLLKANEIIRPIVENQGVKQLVGDLADFTTREEVDVYIDHDYKDDMEMGMELLISHVLRSNFYYEEIEPRVLHDIVECNESYVRLGFDRNNRISVNYGDIEKYVGPATDDTTNRNTEYDGELKMVTIAELRMMIENTGSMQTQREIEEVLYDLAKKASKNNGNPEFKYTHDHFQNAIASGTIPWNDYRVTVMIFSYYTIDSYTWRFKTKDDGTVRVNYEPREGKPVPKGSKNTYVPDDEMTVYEGIYVPGLDKTICWGKQKNISREITLKGFSARPLKRHIYNKFARRYGESSSFVDDTKQIVDDMFDAHLQLRKVVSEHMPSGVYYDWESLINLTLGSTTIKPKHVIQVAKAKGIYPGLMKDEDGRMLRVPVTAINSNLKNEIDTFMMLIAGYVNQFREVSGINEGVDGSVKNSNALVGIQKMKRIAATQLLNETFNAYTQITFKRMADTIRSMIQAQIYYGMCEDEYKEVVGENLYELLKFDASKPYPMLGIHVETMMNEDQLNYLEQTIQLGMKSGDVSFEDAVEARNVTNVKRMAAKVAVNAKRRKKQEHAMQMQMYQAEVEKNAQSAKASSDERIREYHEKTNEDIRKAKELHQLELIKIERKAVAETAGDLRVEEKKGLIDLQKIDRANEIEGGEGGSDIARKPPTFPTPPKKATAPQVEKS